ncbi:MAG: phospho-N-acetylmuramoyl-pentapeptide-transferase [Bacillota bacterium]|nr:phospho-N-acetylmuramoyl-pentapeptide-transferase [Bacillota bacterium]
MTDLVKSMIPAAIIAFFITALTGPLLIPMLHKLKFGQSIREDGPKWHQKKAGTPTMGGFMFIMGIVAAAALFISRSPDADRALAVLSMALSFGFVGFIDDYIKVIKKRNLGLTEKQKMFLQLICAAAFIITLQIMGYINTKLYIPFLNKEIELSIGYYVFAMFAIIAIVNAVNFTDGVDGLAASVTIPAALAYAVIAAFLRAEGVSILLVACAASLLGFLIFNLHPAKVFMGDTGSMFLGGMIAAAAFAINQPLIFLLIGFIYFIEMLSVVLQIWYFKKTKGKRLFKMSPLHHHFELSGWSENKIVVVFTFVTVILSILACIGVQNYYNL